LGPMKKPWSKKIPLYLGSEYGAGPSVWK
jgi:hypothetical protein